jgi:hypothetical protein
MIRRKKVNILPVTHLALKVVVPGQSFGEIFSL